MHYEINVSKDGRHVFATHPRSVTTAREAARLCDMFEQAFPETEDYKIDVTCKETTSITVKPGDLPLSAQDVVWAKQVTLAPEHNYTTDPAQLWPIIDREKIATMYHDEWEVPNWGAWVCAGDDRVEVMGETSLVAAARCYVASKLGEQVEVPEELS